MEWAEKLVPDKGKFSAGRQKYGFQMSCGVYSLLTFVQTIG